MKHLMSTKFAAGLGTVVLTVGMFAGGLVASVSSPSPSTPPGGPGLSADSEDSPGWDCLRQGNVTCRIDGVLVTSLEGMPPVDQPYERCVWLLKLPERLGDPSFHASMCGPVITNGG